MFWVEVTLKSQLYVVGKRCCHRCPKIDLSAARVEGVLSEDALLAAGLYSAAVSNATYVLSTRGFCREMIHGEMKA